MKINILRLILLSLLLISCKQANKNILEVGIYEIVTLEFDNADMAEKYTGDIDGEPVDLFKSDTDQLSFIVPALKPGPHTLNFTLGIVELNVKKADQTKSGFENLNNLLDKSFSDLENLPLIENSYNEIMELKERRNDLLAIYSSLSEEEKIEVSQFISSNKNFFDANKNTIGTSRQPVYPECENEPTRILKLTCDIGKLLPKTKRAVTKVLVFSIASILVADYAAESLTSWSSVLNLIKNPQTLKIVKVSAFAIAVIATYVSLEYLTLKLEIEQLLFEKKVMDFLDLSDLTEGQDTSYIFTNNTPTEVAVNLVWRTLQSYDAYLGPEVSDFIDEITSLNNVIKKVPFISSLLRIKFKKEQENFIEIVNESNISIYGNSQVTFKRENGKVVFYNKSFMDEYFSLSITVEREGYNITKTFPAMVTRKIPACGLSGTIEERVRDCAEYSDLGTDYSLVRLLPEGLKIWRNNSTGLIWGGLNDAYAFSETSQACNSSKAELANINISWRMPSKDEFSDSLWLLGRGDPFGTLGGAPFVWASSSNEPCVNSPLMCTWIYGANTLIFGAYREEHVGIVYCAGEAN